MIYTVTFNPAIDYIVHTDEMETGGVIRSSREEIYIGGKGLNVSQVLKELGKESEAFGFVAGFTGEAIERGMKDYGIAADFVHLEEGFSRINVKVKAEQETEINGHGPEIPEEKIEELFGKLEKLQDGDTIVLAGSIPASLPQDMYERILDYLKDKKVRAVVDATKDLLLNVLKYKPFLIKPNNFELGEMFQVTLHTEEDIVTYAKKLKDMGAVNVLVSMAGDGAILVTKDGKVYETMPPKGKVVNSVGAGDSMVAGFITGYLNTKDMEKAFRLGVAAGSASAFCSWLATRDEIVALLGEPAEVYHI